MNRATAILTRFRTTESRLDDRQTHGDGCWQITAERQRRCVEGKRELGRNLATWNDKRFDVIGSRRLAAGILLQQGRPSAALLKLDVARAKKAPELLIAGAAYIERARLEDTPLDLLRALDVLATATDASPRSSAAWFDLGLAAAGLHLCRTAERSFRTALSLEKDPAWRREIQERLRSAVCLLRRPPSESGPAKVDDEVWRELEMDALFEQGRFAEIVRRASIRLRQHDPPGLRGRLWWMRGLAEMALGRLGSALDSYHAALAAYRAADDLPRQGAVHSLIASAYSVAGNAEESWRHRRRALELLQRTGWRARLDVALVALAYDVYDEGLYRATILVLDEIRLDDAGTTLTDRATVGLYRARALAALGHAAAATDLLQGFAPSFSPRESTIDAAQGGVLQLLAGETLRLLGRNPEAVSLLTSAAHWLEKREERLTLVEALAGRADANLALGHLGSARADLEVARRLLGQERVSLQVLQRPAFFDVTAKVADLAVLVEIKAGDAAAALSALEEGTSQTLRDLLSTRAKERLDGHVDPHAGSWRPPDGVVILRYAVFDDDLYLWRIRAGDTRLFRMRIRKQALRELAVDTATAVQRGLNDDTVQRLERLGRLLLGDLRPGQKVTRIVVVPDDALYAVPFAALRFPGAAGYLVEHAEVQLAPSLALALRPPPPSLPRVDLQTVWVADASAAEMPSLPAARRAAISGHAAWAQLGPATLLVGSDAAVAPVVEALERARIAEIDVHSSSTATFLGSALHLASTTNRSEDVSALAAERIAALELDHLRLVVLASCDSSNSRYRGSEGIGGLQWAFLAAGADAVVSTLWALDDTAAARFTKRMHEHLLDGRSIATAMRLSAVRSIAEDDAAWPAFVHYGADVRVSLTD